MSKEETGKTKEETEVDMLGKEEETEVDTMGPTTEETEVDMMGGKEETDVEAELTEAEEEKQPIAGGGGGEAGNGDAAAFSPEKNGTLNVKVHEDDEAAVKFTGLSKEELLRVAGTPGWVRTRWTLLVLFWLGWLGMLFGAVVIILQAPGCRPLPQMSWWSSGPLYQITNIQAFSDTQDLKGVTNMIDSLAKLKVKGLVLGPIHDAPSDDPVSLRFEDISSEVGTLEQFKSVLSAAHEKGIYVVLDLTPNYQGTGPWYSNSSVTSVAEKMKSALVFWLNQGVDGVQLLGVEHVASVVPSLWADIRAIVQNATEEEVIPLPRERVLIGVTEKTSAEDVSNVLSSTGVDLLLSGVLKAGGGDATAQSVQHLSSSHNQDQLAWNVGDRTQGHLASLVGPPMVTFYQLLLLTLPGTPVFSYGDEIGLVDEDTMFPKMLWDTVDPMELNGTVKEETDQRLNCRSFFSALSALRDKELSLRYGDFVPLFNSSSSMAYLRTWDQSPRYLAVFNWGGAVERLELTEPGLPPQAVVVLSTNGSSLTPATSVDLKALQIGPAQAALLRFPYTSA